MRQGAGTLSDRALLAANRVVTLGQVSEPGGAGQFGVSTRWTVAPWNTEMRLAYARYHSRSAFTNMRKSLIPGNNPFAPLDARNPQTEVVYPEGIQALAFEFKHELKPATVYGSVGYSHPMRNVLGAAGMTLRAELNARLVHDLPDPAQLRFGRAEVFGIGPIAGVCAAGASALTCSNQGYVSRSAWGYNLQAVATYPKAVGAFDLRPRIALAHNVRGTSWDGLLREGRKTVVLGLDALHGQTTLSLTLVRHHGGAYDNAADRDFVAASIATRF